MMPWRPGDGTTQPPSGNNGRRRFGVYGRSQGPPRLGRPGVRTQFGQPPPAGQPGQGGYEGRTAQNYQGRFGGGQNQRTQQWMPPRQSGGGFQMPQIPTYDLSQIPNQTWSKGDVSRQQAAAKSNISSGAEDGIRNLEMMLAGTGASGALAERSTEILGEAGRQGGQASADIQQTANRENAQQALARGGLGAQLQGLAQNYALGSGNLANQSRGLDVTQRGQDINLQTAEGRNAVDRELAQLTAQTTGRGQDLSWLQAQLAGDVTMRGQDVTQRSDEMDYNLGNRRIDQQARGDDMNWTLGGRGQDIDANNAGMSALLQALGLGSSERGQNMGFLGQWYNQGNQNFWQNQSQIMDLLRTLGPGSGRQGY